MSTVNSLTLSKTVTSNTRTLNIGETIRSADTSAYLLELAFLDVAAIDGTCNLHFVLPDGTTADRDASDGVAIDNTGGCAKISYMLTPELYSAEGVLACYVQFMNSNLYTPLKITFSGIRVVPGGEAVATTEPYPTWAADMRALDFDIGTVTTLAEGESATAEITGTVPDKVLNLGIPAGATGADGAKGDTGASITSGAIVADDIVFTKDDATTVTLTGAVTALTGPAGPAGATGATGTTAYESAITGGYTDTLANFYLDLAAMQGLEAELGGIVG